jgi:hypothetical protein
VDIYVEAHRVEKGLHAVITERRLCDPELDAIMGASEAEAVRRTRASLQLWGRDGDLEAVAFMTFSLLEGAVHGHVLSHPMVSDQRFADGLVEALMRLGAPAEVLPYIGAPSTEKAAKRKSPSSHGAGKRQAVPVSR